MLGKSHDRIHSESYFLDLALGLAYFTITYLGVSRYEQMVLVVGEDNTNLDIRTIDDLTKFETSFGIQQDYYYSAAFNERLKTDQDFAKHFDYFPVAFLNNKTVEEGHILGFFEDKMAALYKINNDSTFRGLAVHSFALTEPEPVYFGASKKLDEEKNWPNFRRRTSLSNVSRR